MMVFHWWNEYLGSPVLSDQHGSRFSSPLNIYPYNVRETIPSILTISLLITLRVAEDKFIRVFVFS